MWCVVNGTPLYRWERDPVPTAQDAGWATGPVKAGAEIWPPSVFDPLTVHSVASRNTDYAVPATLRMYVYDGHVIGRR